MPSAGSGTDPVDVVAGSADLLYRRLPMPRAMANAAMVAAIGSGAAVGVGLVAGIVVAVVAGVSVCVAVCVVTVVGGGAVGVTVAVAVGVAVVSTPIRFPTVNVTGSESGARASKPSGVLQTAQAEYIPGLPMSESTIAPGFPGSSV